MKPLDPAVLHDLMSPLAKAKTAAKLLAQDLPEEQRQLAEMLLASLEELDAKIQDLAAH